VQLALKAQRLLADKKVAVRVVSMPSTTTFDREDTKYKKAVLPTGLPRVAVEMGVTDGWWKYGCAAVVGIDTYGESAPAPVLFKHFGFTEENVAGSLPTLWPVSSRRRRRAACRTFPGRSWTLARAPLWKSSWRSLRQTARPR
jgi:transketolase